MIRRDFLKWFVGLTGGYFSFRGVSALSPMTKMNTVLFSEAHAASTCGQDRCKTRDACEGDSVGHTCTQKDICNIDESGNCQVDECVLDQSGACTQDKCTTDQSGTCTQDNCTTDRSGNCSNDTCVADSSGGCTNDWCRSDKSGECTDDTCQSDYSGGCAKDSCVSDKSSTCENDTCQSDMSGKCTTSDTCDSDLSGECGTDVCRVDKSSSCSTKDVCTLDGSGTCTIDLCREDRSTDCAASDTCALDSLTGQAMGRRGFARTGINQAIKWLYELACIAVFLVLAGGAAFAEPVIDATTAVFSDEPAYITNTPVAISSPVGPFLRDCGGVLRADTNGDGQCEGDPEVKDYSGKGTRELPPDTPFTGTFEFTCFHIPDDVAISATGPLNIKASQEVAVFGSMRLVSGAEIACPEFIDLRTSSWLTETRNITFTTALRGEVLSSANTIGDGDYLPRITFVSSADVTTTALRAVVPQDVTFGSQVFIRGSNLGTKKGTLYMGSLKTAVSKWTDKRLTVLLTKVPLPGGLYDATIQPKEPKNAPPVVLENAFMVRSPVIHYATPDSALANTRAKITIYGQFFGKTKGTVTLDGKPCSVQKWTMNPATGESTAAITIPKVATDSVYNLVLTNAVGSSTIEFEIAAP